MTPKIFVVVLNWNNAPDTLECLASVQAIVYPNYATIVVDNGSSDGSLAEIRAACPALHYLANGANLGFAEGNNRGIAYALAHGAEYVLVLNNDTVVDPDILSSFMQAAAANPEAGVFGAKIYYYDQPSSVWYAGGEVHPLSARCYHIIEAEETVHPTSYACGCALLIKAETARRVGLMEPRFFLIWEEIDWCWRIRQAGYGCLYVPQAKLWHKISASFEGGNRGPLWQYYYWRNRLFFLERHTPFPKLIYLYLRTLIKEIGALIYTSCNPLVSAATRCLHRAALRGVRDYLFRRF